MSDEPADSPKTPPTKGPTLARKGQEEARARQERLAQALRDNLRRRKTQTRARRDGGD